MPHFAANLSMLYPEHDFLDRMGAAARDGFTAVECLFPYDHASAIWAARLRDEGLRQVLFNAPPGDWAKGDRGFAGLQGREAEFRDSVERALAYAVAIACPCVHVMAGIPAADASIDAAQGLYTANLAWAAERAHQAGVTVLIEPLNPRDMPGYLLRTQAQAHRIVQAVGSPHLKVQMDLYHCQITEGDVTIKLREHLRSGRVGHLQIAGVPDRHEPDEGELNHRHLFAEIDSLMLAGAWDGWIGCEYRPKLGAQPGGTTSGLAWMDRLGVR